MARRLALCNMYTQGLYRITITQNVQCGLERRVGDYIEEMEHLVAIVDGQLRLAHRALDRPVHVVGPCADAASGSRRRRHSRRGSRCGALARFAGHAEHLVPAHFDVVHKHGAVLVFVLGMPARQTITWKMAHIELMLGLHPCAARAGAAPLAVVADGGEAARAHEQCVAAPGALAALWRRAMICHRPNGARDARFASATNKGSAAYHYGVGTPSKFRCTHAASLSSRCSSYSSSSGVGTSRRASSVKVGSTLSVAAGISRPLQPVAPPRAATVPSAAVSSSESK